MNFSLKQFNVIVIGMYRARVSRSRSVSVSVSLRLSRSRSVSVSVSLGLGQCRSRSVSVSVSVGFGQSRARYIPSHCLYELGFEIGPVFDGPAGPFPGLVYASDSEHFLVASIAFMFIYFDSKEHVSM
jgi:hypothetical protein